MPKRAFGSPWGSATSSPKHLLEIFAEIVPVIEFAPDTDGDVDGAIGIRYYFKNTLTAIISLHGKSPFRS